VDTAGTIQWQGNFNSWRFAILRNLRNCAAVDYTGKGDDSRSEGLQYPRAFAGRLAGSHDVFGNQNAHTRRDFKAAAERHRARFVALGKKRRDSKLPPQFIRGYNPAKCRPHHDIDCKRPCGDVCTDAVRDWRKDGCRAVSVLKKPRALKITVRMPAGRKQKMPF
jgi:hypothetical protein